MGRSLGTTLGSPVWPYGSLLEGGAEGPESETGGVVTQQEFGVMGPRAKESWWPLKAGKARKRVL